MAGSTLSVPAGDRVNPSQPHLPLVVLPVPQLPHRGAHHRLRLLQSTTTSAFNRFSATHMRAAHTATCSTAVQYSSRRHISTVQYSTVAVISPLALALSADWDWDWFWYQCGGCAGTTVGLGIRAFFTLGPSQHSNAIQQRNTALSGYATCYSTQHSHHLPCPKQARVAGAPSCERATYTCAIHRITRALWVFPVA